MFKRHAPSQVNRRPVKRSKLPLTPLTKTWRNAAKTEVKQIDTIIPVTTPTANGDVFTFGLVDQGVDNNQRIGKSVSTLSGESRIQFSGDISSDFTNWRVVIGVWKQAYGGQVPTPSDVFQLPGSLISPINAEGSENLVILSDKTYNISPTLAIGGPVVGAPTSRYATVKWRHRMTQEYKGIAFIDIQNAAFFIMVTTDNVGGGNCRIHNRVYFTDN